MNSITIIKSVISRIPAVLSHLRGRARWIAFSSVGGEEYKTAEQMESRIVSLVKALYNGTISAASFVDSMAALISRQITLAYREAWTDEGDGGNIPDYLTSASDEAILAQFDFVDQYARDIVDAAIDKKPIDGLLVRAGMWAQQWTTSYRKAVELIRLHNGGNLMWKKGATEHGCSTCANLDGIVMSAKEWEQLGVHPRGYPNPKLECEGGGPVNNCDCELVPTDQRRSPGAYGQVEEIIL